MNKRTSPDHLTKEAVWPFRRLTAGTGSESPLSQNMHLLNSSAAKQPFQFVQHSLPLCLLACGLQFCIDLLQAAAKLNMDVAAKGLYRGRLKERRHSRTQFTTTLGYENRIILPQWIVTIPL